MRAPVGIVGFRGYSGAELVAILQRHSLAEPVLLEHRSDSGVALCRAATPDPGGSHRALTP